MVPTMLIAYFFPESADLSPSSYLWLVPFIGFFKIFVNLPLIGIHFYSFIHLFSIVPFIGPYANAIAIGTIAQEYSIFTSMVMFTTSSFFGLPSSKILSLFSIITSMTLLYGINVYARKIETPVRQMLTDLFNSFHFQMWIHYFFFYLFEDLAVIYLGFYYVARFFMNSHPSKFESFFIAVGATYYTATIFGGRSDVSRQTIFK